MSHDNTYRISTLMNKRFLYLLLYELRSSVFVMCGMFIEIALFLTNHSLVLQICLKHTTEIPRILLILTKQN